MFVCGTNDLKQLGEKSNISHIICPPCKSHINPTNLLSISIFSDHLVIVDKRHEAYGIGFNRDGVISPNLPIAIFQKEKQIEIKSKSGQPLKFISAVCGYTYTLYEVTSDIKNDNAQLVFISDNQIYFVNIFGRIPCSLFGGSKTAAVIDTEGWVIFLTSKKLKRTKGDALSVRLPSCERAVEAACCNKFFIVCDALGRLFESPVENGDITDLREVSELSGERIISVAGSHNHCFAVCEDGRVFVRGHNLFTQLGLPKGKNSEDKFTYIESLSKHKIVSAFAGVGHSIFKTSTGKILGCGSNQCGDLLLNEPSKQNEFFYPPIELPSICSDPFFILGNTLTVFMSEKDVPPKTPNRKINLKLKTSIQKSSGSTLEEKEAKIQRLEEENKNLKKENDTQKKENDTLKKENDTLKKENDTLKKNEAKYKQRITDLENELKATKKSTSKGSTNRNSSDIEKGVFKILDDKTLSTLHRLKRIGRGGTSEVFEVSRETHFAQKFLLFDEEIDIEDMKHLVREYEALVSVNSRYIVSAFGMSFGTETEAPSILLELCASNLKKRVSELNNQERVQVICELSEGMCDIHRAGIIHGDLKLENILLDEFNYVKVGDFGHCHIMNSMQSASSREIAGTLKFMAPELIQERTDYDEKIDVYAFGVVVYVIVMKGEFPKISIADVAVGKKAKIPPCVQKFTSELINRCWAFKASDRPSFDEICKLLDGNEHKII